MAKKGLIAALKGLAKAFRLTESQTGNVVEAVEDILAADLKQAVTKELAFASERAETLWTALLGELNIAENDAQKAKVLLMRANQKSAKARAQAAWVSKFQSALTAANALEPAEEPTAEAETEAA